MASQDNDNQQPEAQPAPGPGKQPIEQSAQQPAEQPAKQPAEQTAAMPTFSGRPGEDHIPDEIVGARARAHARLAAAEAAGKAAREEAAAAKRAREARAAKDGTAKRKKGFGRRAQASSDQVAPVQPAAQSADQPVAVQLEGGSAASAPMDATADAAAPKRKSGIPFVARVLLVIAFVVFLFGYDFLATGWGTAPQDQAKAAIQKQLDQFAAGEDCSLRQEVDKTLATFACDTDDVAKAWGTDLSMKFQDYTRNSEGTTATWQVTLSCKQLSAALTKNLASAISFDKQLAAGQIGQDQFAEQMRQAVINGFDETSTVDLHLTLEVNQVGNAWELTPDSLSALCAALQGDVAQISDAMEASRS